MSITDRYRLPGRELEIYSLPASVYEQLRSIATEVGIVAGPECIFQEEPLAPMLAELVAAGGSWCPVGGPTVWEGTVMALPRDLDDALLKATPDADLGSNPVPRRVLHADGVFIACLRRHRVLLAGVQLPSATIRNRRHGVVALGESRSAIAGFLRDLRNHRPRPRLHLWGGAPQDRLSPPDVPESAVVLPEPLKGDLLAWLDRFWKLGGLAAQHRLPIRRGLLLVGAPGTGKTNFVRHLLSRYPGTAAHLFIASRQQSGSDPFADMLSALRNSPDGAMVILEDIDRIAESGMVTREFLLNCLDGLLEIPVPLLWIATSNDPSSLERSLLDRPGRFDRTVIFPLPELDERVALVKWFSTLPLTAECVVDAAVVSAGLTGAHIREGCAAATLQSLDLSNDYGSLLVAELAGLQRQHAAARRLASELSPRDQAGFRSV